MSDAAFLKELIQEPVYLVKGAEADRASIAPTPSPAVYAEEQPVSVAEEPKAEIKLKALSTSGNNLKACIILVNWANEALTEEKELLLKILGSVKRSEDDVLLVHAKNATGEQIEAILAEHKHKQLIDFGTNTCAPLQSLALYSPQSEGPRKMLRADALSEIGSDVEKKKSLWKALQQMFL